MSSKLNNKFELCQDEKHLKKLNGVHEDLNALKSLDADDIDDIDVQQIKFLNKYIELAELGLNIDTFGKALNIIRSNKEDKTGTSCLQIVDIKDLKERIGNKKQVQNSHLAILRNLSTVLPNTHLGKNLDKELQETLNLLDGILKRRSELIMYEECYPVLSKLEGLPKMPTDQNLITIMKMYPSETVDKLIDTRGKKGSSDLKIRGIHGLWKESIRLMFDECQHIGMSKTESHSLILDFLAVASPDIWRYSEKTKPQLIKVICGHCMR